MNKISQGNFIKWNTLDRSQRWKWQGSHLVCGSTISANNIHQDRAIIVSALAKRKKKWTHLKCENDRDFENKWPQVQALCLWCGRIIFRSKHELKPWTWGELILVFWKYWWMFWQQSENPGNTPALSNSGWRQNSLWTKLPNFHSHLSHSGIELGHNKSSPLWHTAAYLTGP